MASTSNRIPGAGQWADAPAPSGPAVMLVAHGSARSGASAEPVLALAEALRRRGRAEVRTAFWKEEPFLHQALDAVRGAPVLVLPVFLAEGYFTRVVVPRETGLAYGANRRGGRTVHLLRPLGAAPGLDELVEERAREAAGSGARLEEAALVVVGHGTPRDPGSADTVLALSRTLAERGRCARVAPAFLDQDPRVQDVVAAAREPLVVLVPFLVASGWHGGTTLPRDLEEAGDAARRRGTLVVVAEPVGTHPRLADVVERRLAAAAGDVSEADGAGAGADLVACLGGALDRAGGAATFLQVHIERTAPHRWELRHVADAGAAPASLTPMGSVAALERRARHREDGRHRPLRTAGDLPRGWRAPGLDGAALVEALVALYGPALAHWAAALGGGGGGAGLPVRSFPEAAARQSGLYAPLRGASAHQVAAGIRRCCDGLPCLRQRRWPPPGAGAPGGEPEASGGVGVPPPSPVLVVPCSEPCPVLLTSVLEGMGGVRGG